MARAQENHSLHEVLSLLLLGLGTLLFLALISYSPADVPSWFPLSSVASPRGPVLNFIGRLGAISACCSYAFLGAASYLIAALLLGYGGAKLLKPELRLTQRAFWSIGFVISGACLAHLLPWPLLDMRHLNIDGQGGWVGKWIGGLLFKQLLGVFGSLIVLSLLYACSLILLTGIHPISLAAQIAGWPSQWMEKRRLAQMAKADEQGRLSLEAERIAKERKKIEKTLVKKGVQLPPEPEPIPAAEQGDVLTLVAEEEAPRPAPQIIDSSLPPPPKKKDAKKDRFQPLSSFSCDNYELPSLELLESFESEERQAADPAELRAIQDVVIDTLGQFGILVSPGDITRGPTITRYEVYPAKGVRVDKIVSLERDIARATCAERINILAPIPGKDTVGIEIANSKKQKVTLRELLDSDDFRNSKAKIPLALGKDVYGKTIIADLAAMPHGLVAGTTGSGKSVCINSIIASILYRFTPEDLRFIMIDPKVVEMQIYNTLPHLVVPVVTDPKKVLLALRWAIDEMEKRYAIFAKTGVRNIGTFNARPLPKSQAELDAIAAAKTAETLELALNSDPIDPVEPAEPIDPESLSSEERIEKMTKVSVPRDSDLIIPNRMPYIVIIVDELADLMQTAPADVESAIARITQKARAAGIHMIIATQTPRADVITGVIKANVPCRIAFQVASGLDSRVILDENGAERLLGQGDMLYRPPGTARNIRAQGVLVTDDEIQKVVDHASAQSAPAFENSIHERLQNGDGGDGEAEVSDEDEELVDKCVEIMRQEKKASTSLFQRRLRLGYTRAARILDILETRGYVGPGENAKPREILVDLDALD